MCLNISVVLDKSHLSNDAALNVTQIVLRAQSSTHAIKAMNDTASIGELFSNTAMKIKPNLFKYATKITQLDQRFLEQIRDEICIGMDAFDTFGSMGSDSETRKEVKGVLKSP